MKTELLKTNRFRCVHPSFLYDVQQIVDSPSEGKDTRQDFITLCRFSIYNNVPEQLLPIGSLILIKIRNRKINFVGTVTDKDYVKIGKFFRAWTL